MRAQGFRKQERMVSQVLIQTLFEGSHSMAAFPLRAVYMTMERDAYDAPVQLLISVPKKRFKHAVDRNRVKRQLREAFRHHKQVLYDALPADKRLLLAFVWQSDRHQLSADIDRKVYGLLQRVSERLQAIAEKQQAVVEKL